jgi:hypothetical protein
LSSRNWGAYFRTTGPRSWEKFQESGEHECKVVGHIFRVDGGMGGQGIVRADGVARYSAVGEDENSGDRVDVFLNLSRDVLLMELISLNTASVGQTRCLEDANLAKSLLCPPTAFNPPIRTTIPLLLKHESGRE